MILCQCAGVTDATVERMIREGAESVEAVALRCGAGRSCPPCRDEIAAMIQRIRKASRDTESPAPGSQMSA